MLNNEQIKIAYGFFAKKRIFDEDIKQDLLLYLCQNIHNYDCEKGKQTTFIYNALNNKLKNMYKSNCTNKRTNTFGTVHCDNEKLKFEIRDEKDDYDDIVIEDLLKVKLTKKEYDICKLRLNGYTYEEISNIYSCTKQNIYLIINNIRRKINIG